MLIYTPSPWENHITLPSENKTDIEQKTQTTNQTQKTRSKNELKDVC